MTLNEITGVFMLAIPSTFGEDVYSRRSIPSVDSTQFLPESIDVSHFYDVILYRAGILFYRIISCVVNLMISLK